MTVQGRADRQFLEYASHETREVFAGLKSFVFLRKARGGVGEEAPIQTRKAEVLASSRRGFPFSGLRLGT